MLSDPLIQYAFKITESWSFNMLQEKKVLFADICFVSSKLNCKNAHLEMSRKNKACTADIHMSMESRMFQLNIDIFERILVLSTTELLSSQLSSIRQDFGMRAILDCSKLSAKISGIKNYTQHNPENNDKLGMILELEKYLHGSVGVLFTNMSIEQVEAVLNKHIHHKRPKPGTTFNTELVIEPHSTQLDPTHTYRLRNIGFQTLIRRGLVVITEKFTFCKKGERVSEEKFDIMNRMELKPNVAKCEILHVFEPGLNYSVADMMPLVECRLEEALFEVCCFGVGSKMFTYYTAEELKEIEKEKERRAKALTVTVYEESSDESADWMELFG